MRTEFHAHSIAFSLKIRSSAIHNESLLTKSVVELQEFEPTSLRAMWAMGWSTAGAGVAAARLAPRPRYVWDAGAHGVRLGRV